MNNLFKIIRFHFFKEKLPKIIFFNNINETESYYLKKIAIWLMCLERKDFICKNCASCINFKLNINYDYYESIIQNNENVEQEISYLENFIKTKPVISKIKVTAVYLNIENKNIIKLLLKISKYNDTYIFLVLKKDFYDIKQNYPLLYFYTKYRNMNISINFIKILYNYVLKKNYKNIFSYLINENKLKIINSLIFFFHIYKISFYLNKRKILLNKKIKNIILKKNINFLLIFLNKYKKSFLNNNNLNTFLLINFILKYIED